MLIGTKHSGYSRANIRLYFDPVTIMAAGAGEVAAITAAEIAAAEAAAIAAAEAAAVASAEAAAVQAAQAAAATAAETGAITAAEAGAAQAAQQAGQAGIMQVGGPTAAQAPLTSEAVQTIAQQAGQNLAPETLTRGIQGVPEVANAPYQFSQAELDALTRGQEIARASSAAPPLETTAGFNLKGTMLENTFLNNPSTVTNEMLRNPSITSIPATPPAASVTPPAIPQAVTPSYLQTPTVAPGSGPMTPFEYQLNAPPDTMQGLRLGTGTEGLSMPNTQVSSLSQLPTAEPPSSLMKGLNSAMNWAKENKFQAATGAFMGAKALGLLDSSGKTPDDGSYDGPLSKYRLSPDFKGSTATPNIYKPTYPTYAEGGIMNAGPVQSMSNQNDALSYQQTMAATGGQVAHFAKGGNLSDSLDYYKSMMGDKKLRAPSDPAYVGSVGIARDDDPDTRSRDALTAAQIRNSKVANRANLSIPNMKRPTPMGQINLAAPGVKRSDKEDAQEYASGGITGSGNLDLSIPLDIGGGGGGGYGGYGGGSYPFANSGGAAQTGFTGQNNAAGGGFGNPLAAAGAPAQDTARTLSEMLAGKFNPASSGGSVADRRFPSFAEQAASQQLSTAGLPKFAGGGIMGASNLGGYAAGGNPRLLRGPGDGMSDNIPAVIGKKQPARLADGEFVIPADVVSHLGNGSTEAGAKRLHEMMNKVRKDRTGNSKQGKQIVASKYMPR